MAGQTEPSRALGLLRRVCRRLPLGLLAIEFGQFLELGSPVIQEGVVQLGQSAGRAQRADGAGGRALALESVGLQRVVGRAGSVLVGLGHPLTDEVADVQLCLRVQRSGADAALEASVGLGAGGAGAGAAAVVGAVAIGADVAAKLELLGAGRVAEGADVEGLRVLLASALIVVGDHVLAHVLLGDDEWLLLAPPQRDEEDHDRWGERKETMKRITIAGKKEKKQANMRSIISYLITIAMINTIIIITLLSSQ